MIEYYLGIDGGGTKTEFALADRKGVCLKNIILGACNPNDVGMERTIDILRKGILDVCEGIPLEKISVFAGIAGGATGKNGQEIRGFLEGYSFGQVNNGSDALNAVSAFLRTEDGIAVIMGTGSIAFAQKKEQQIRVGGYGYLLGDVGSGYELGREGIFAALADEDGSGPPTLIRRLVLERCGGTTIWEKLSDFYAGGKREIAGYAPCVFAAYTMGDQAASGIIRRNLEGVAGMIEGCAKHLTHLDVIPVVLGGGITRQSELLLPILNDILKESKHTYDLRICTRNMVYGALLLAGMGKDDKGRRL